MPSDSDVHKASSDMHFAPPGPMSFLDSGPGGSILAKHSFPNAIGELRDSLDNVLIYKDNPEELEHQAILFWPSLSKLHPWLGKGPRESELITHFDILRAQFRLHPVTSEILTALREVLHKAATATCLTEDLVDECLDLLESAGADLRFPLAFVGKDEN
jgi:hypothetical protein